MKKSKLEQLKKRSNRKEFLDENWDFFLFQLWDEDLLESLLSLPIKDEELYDLCETIVESLENSWNEGYDEATDTIRQMLEDGEERPTYHERRAVVESDYN